MTIRSTTWLAAALLAATATPALAQDERYHPGPPPPLPEEGAWEEEWDEEWEEQAGADYAHDDEGYRDEHGGRHGGPPAHRGAAPHGRGHAMGYPPEARAHWLDQCRATYHDERGRRRGQVIGGVLGAVAGGVVGSEIADGDDNLGGTLIGAGVGGLAGVAIGGAIGAQSDRGRVDECESYLLRHEQSYRGYGHGDAPGYAEGAVGYHYPYPYPVMWVKVPIHTVRRGDCGCETVVEEWIEEEPAPPPARRAKRVKIQRVVATPGKRVRTGE